MSSLNFSFFCLLEGFFFSNHMLNACIVKQNWHEESHAYTYIDIIQKDSPEKENNFRDHNLKPYSISLPLQRQLYKLFHTPWS